jgi:hypothetical protein
VHDFFGTLGDRKETIHDALDNLGHEDHDCTHLDAERQSLLGIVTGEETDDGAEDGADDDGLTQNADLLLQTVDGDVDLL